MSKVYITFGVASVLEVLNVDSLEGQTVDLPDANAKDIDCPPGKSIAVIQPDADIFVSSSSDKLGAGKGHLVRGGVSCTLKVAGGKLFMKVRDDA